MTPEALTRSAPADRLVCEPYRADAPRATRALAAWMAFGLALSSGCAGVDRRGAPANRVILCDTNAFGGLPHCDVASAELMWASTVAHDDFRVAVVERHRHVDDPKLRACLSNPNSYAYAAGYDGANIIVLFYVVSDCLCGHVMTGTGATYLVRPSDRKLLSREFAE